MLIKMYCRNHFIHIWPVSTPTFWLNRTFLIKMEEILYIRLASRILPVILRSHEFHFSQHFVQDSMKRALLTWLGTADMKALTAAEQTNLGPLRQVISEKGFDIVYIMSNRKHDETKQCVDILKKWRKKLHIEEFQYDFTNPTDYELVLKYTEQTLTSIRSRLPSEVALTFFVTPGTPIMVAVLCMMAERLPQVSLIQSTQENGVQFLNWSIPNYLTSQNIEEISRNASSDFPDNKVFRKLVLTSEIMREKHRQAINYARYNIPILILGESGTGKGEFAEGIHRASPRSSRPFISVNCGAISPGLIGSELFGAEKGSFSGAVKRIIGKFEAAEHGTIFLDEIGEMPLDQQVNLLKVLDNKEITPIGMLPKTVDVRIIAATNRNLRQMVSDGTFREDLYYRLSVAMIYLPPFRERGPDLLLAANEALTYANHEIFEDACSEYKEFSTDVKLFISAQEWPGNYREIRNVMIRAVLNATGKILTVSDMQAAMMLDMRAADKNVGSGFELPPYTSDGSFNLDDALKAVTKHYIEQALKDAGGRKTKAYSLLGLGSYQTLSDRMKKCGIEGLE